MIRQFTAVIIALLWASIACAADVANIPGPVIGTTTNDNAAAGNVGEIVTATVLSGAPVSLTSSVAANVTSINLTPGDWDVSGNCGYLPATATTTTAVLCAFNTVSATLPAAPNNGGEMIFKGAIAANLDQLYQVGTMRVSISAPTTVFLIEDAFFAVSTASAYGFIRARRSR